MRVVGSSFRTRDLVWCLALLRGCRAMRLVCRSIVDRRPYSTNSVDHSTSMTRPRSTNLLVHDKARPSSSRIDLFRCFVSTESRGQQLRKASPHEYNRVAIASAAHKSLEGRRGRLLGLSPKHMRASVWQQLGATSLHVSKQSHGTSDRLEE